MRSVVLAQCDPSMEAKLQVTEGWENNKADLLFVLTAAQAACIGMQQNFSMHVEAREAYRSLANCFQNNDTALVYKTRYIACKKKCDKAGIGFTFSKKFLDSEKKKNPKLDDAVATKAAENRFLGTMWLLNTEVPSNVTNNLVQAHIAGIDNYPENIERAFTMVSFTEEASSSNRTATFLAQTYEPSWGCETGVRSRGPRQGTGRGSCQPGRMNQCHLISVDNPR